MKYLQHSHQDSSTGTDHESIERGTTCDVCELACTKAYDLEKHNVSCRHLRNVEEAKSGVVKDYRCDQAHDAEPLDITNARQWSSRLGEANRALAQTNEAFKNLIAEHVRVVNCAERLDAYVAVQSDTLILAKKTIDKMLPVFTALGTKDKKVWAEIKDTATPDLLKTIQGDRSVLISQFAMARKGREHIRENMESQSLLVFLYEAMSSEKAQHRKRHLQRVAEAEA